MTSIRRKALVAMLMAVAIVPSITTLPSSSAAPARQALGQAGTAAKPTIVLVHGAWADASSWNGVIKRLQAEGYTVEAPPNPLRGPTYDSAYLSSILDDIAGPIILVGHSYGGFVITNAATGNDNVKALVYVTGFAPDEGESVGSIAASGPGSELTPDTLHARPYPMPDGTTGTDLYITADSYRRVFAQDVSSVRASMMAAAQRPIEAAALGGPSGVPAWKTIASWYLVATSDRVIPPDGQRFMAQRASARMTEVAGSHAVLVSKPGLVSDFIMKAARRSS
jgi:pimeloyl-ACP methyl ester carboxylesterase